MPPKKKTGRKTSKRTVTARKIVVHCLGKKITIPNDPKAVGKVNAFVCDKMKLGSFQLVTSADESGKVVALTNIGSFEGTDLYAIERNKAQ